MLIRIDKNEHFGHFFKTEVEMPSFMNKYDKSAHSWLTEKIRKNYEARSLKAAWEASARDGKGAFDNYEALYAAAKRWLTKTGPSVESRLAKMAGFGSAEMMRQAFHHDETNAVAGQEFESEISLRLLSQFHEENENHEEAIKLLRRMHDMQTHSSRLTRAELKRRIGTQFRHIGKYDESVEWYTKARNDVDSIDWNELHSERRKFYLLHIDFNIGMVSWFRNGDTKTWLSNLEQISQKASSLISAFSDDDKLFWEHKLLHIKRQISEAYRYTGKYSASQILSDSLTSEYNLVFSGQSAAWSKVISLDSLRMLIGDGEGISDRDVEIQRNYRNLALSARLHGWKRLESRCMKGWFDIEISRNRSSIPSFLNIGSQFHARLSEQLLLGRWHLIQGKYQAAEFHFRSARDLTGSKDTPVLLERGISELGLAECRRLHMKRMTKVTRNELITNYLRLEGIFSAVGFSWGLVRCRAAIFLLKGNLNGNGGDFPSFEGRDKRIYSDILCQASANGNQRHLFDCLI